MIPPLYVIKLKSKKNEQWHYVNDGIIMDSDKLDEDHLDLFIYKNLGAARKTVLNLILQKRPDIKALKIVELSHYEPFPEHSVIDYQEF